MRGIRNADYPCWRPLRYGRDVVGVFATLEDAKALAQSKADDEMNSRKIPAATIHYVIETWNGTACNWADDIHVYGKCDHTMAVSDSYCNNCGHTLS